MQPNFVLMNLPGEKGVEFVEILPFTPANRNNLIGWIAARSDGANYGTSLVYNFPKTKLVDGPLQIEARIDQNAQLSAQLTLWNQQGSHVRRGVDAGDPIRTCAAVCGTDLSAGGEKSDAGVASGRARTCKITWRTGQPSNRQWRCFLEQQRQVQALILLACRPDAGI